MMDTGLVVIIFIASCMIISVISILSFVKYEWCPVLFENNTVNASDKQQLPSRYFVDAFIFFILLKPYPQ